MRLSSFDGRVGQPARHDHDKGGRTGDLNPDIYFTLIADGLQSQVYVTEDLMEKPNVSDWVRDLTDELIYLAGRCPVGMVLERRGDLIVPRILEQAAS